MSHAVELREKKRRLYIAHVVLPTHDHHVPVLITLARGFPCHPSHAVQPQEVESLGEGIVIHRDSAALATSQILGGVEAETRSIRQFTRADSVARSFDAMSGILNNAQAIPNRDRLERVHVAHQAVEMHR